MSASTFIKRMCEQLRRIGVEQDFRDFMHGTNNLIDTSNVDDWDEFTTIFRACIDELETLLNEKAYDRSDDDLSNDSPEFYSWENLHGFCLKLLTELDETVQTSEGEEVAEEPKYGAYVSEDDEDRDYGFLNVGEIANWSEHDLEQEVDEKDTTRDHGSSNGEGTTNEETNAVTKRLIESLIADSGAAMEEILSILATAAAARAEEPVKEQWEIIADKIETELKKVTVQQPTKLATNPEAASAVHDARSVEERAAEARDKFAAELRK